MDRFLAAAKGRHELPIVICELGQYRGPLPSDPPLSAWTGLPEQGLNIVGQRLPLGVQLRVPEDLSVPDRDLAVRLKTIRSNGPWYMLREQDKPDLPRTKYAPLLMSDLNEVVAAAWPSDHAGNWYLLPWGLPWEAILAWLESQALPGLVPTALARTHRSIDDTLLTPREREATAQLEEFERRARDDRAKLQQEIEDARRVGDEQRHGLLYGSGESLVQAVAKLLEYANFGVEKLDETFGSGRSGDLLVTKDDRNWLIEVTSNSGATSEIEVGKLLAHLETWHRLRKEPLEGAVLIVNHDFRRPPSARPEHPYRRPEFVSGLKVRVIGTVSLCSWWVQKDHAAITSAITGPPGQVFYQATTDRRAGQRKVRKGQSERSP